MLAQITLRRINSIKCNVNVRRTVADAALAALHYYRIVERLAMGQAVVSILGTLQVRLHYFHYYEHARQPHLKNLLAV